MKLYIRSSAARRPRAPSSPSGRRRRRPRAAARRQRRAWRATSASSRPSPPAKGPLSIKRRHTLPQKRGPHLRNKGSLSLREGHSVRRARPRRRPRPQERRPPLLRRSRDRGRRCSERWRTGSLQREGPSALVLTHPSRSVLSGGPSQPSLDRGALQMHTHLPSQPEDVSVPHLRVPRTGMHEKKG